VLRLALESLLAQTFNHTLEYIIVDDLSTDDTPAILRDFQQRSRHRVTIVQGTGQGVAAARNLGSSRAAGIWIASFDDDQIAQPNWLQSLRDLADTTNAVSVGGALALQLPVGVSIDSLGPRVRRVLGEHLIGDTPILYTHGLLPATNNVLIRRDIFARLGGYNITFTEGGEDKDFFERVTAAGHSLWFQPAALALHITPASRLERPNLRWTSLRLGASDARVQQRKLRFLAPLWLASLRVPVAYLRDLPLLLFAKLRRDPSATIDDILCSLWYTQGLLRALPAILFPRLASRRFLRSLDFRVRNGER